MRLSLEFNDARVALVCPVCSHTFVKKGSWLRTVSRYKCEGCGAKVRIGYEEKLAIFESHLGDNRPVIPQMQSRNKPPRLIRWS